jgi:hypothetical protein
VLSDWGIEALTLTHAQVGWQKPNEPRIAIIVKLYVVVVTFGRKGLTFFLDVIQDVIAVIVWTVLVTHLRFLLLVSCVSIQLIGLSLIWLGEHRVGCSA